MQIGKLIRTVVVEPLESPVPAVAPEPDKAEPVEPMHEPHPEPVHDPVTQ